MKKVLLLSGLLLCLPGCSQKEFRAMPLIVKSIADVEQLITCDTACLRERTRCCYAEVEKLLESVIKIPAQERTFDNTIRAFDSAAALLSNVGSLVHMFELLSSNEKMSISAHQLVVQIENFGIDHFEQNIPLYRAIVTYYDGNRIHEQLDDEQQFIARKVMRRLRRFGLHLPIDVQNELQGIKKELFALSLQYERNVSLDTRTILVDRAALAGVSARVIDHLPRAGDKYVIGVDYPIVMQIMENCSVVQTRKALWFSFMNRGYPANEVILKRVVELRDHKASFLGYESYADFELEDCMAKDIKHVETFLHDLTDHVATKAQQEIALLQSHLPDGVVITPDEKFQPWDFTYVKACYKKQYLSIDEQEIAKYFPLESTLSKLLEIYAQFLSLTFVPQKISGLWDPQVQLISVRDKQKRVLGYVFMDLHPRPHKHTHACEINVIKGRKYPDGRIFPAVVVMIANFPCSNVDSPALLPREDVITFFHEFGHAMHDVLGGAQFFDVSGTTVKRDFIEVPSQMFEEWMWDTGILQQVSCHYQTGKPLDPKTIAGICKLKKFDSGDLVLRQIFYAQLSLAYFKRGAKKDLAAIKRTLWHSLRSYLVDYDDEHLECSFGHLINYGSQYYSYLWSKVFALDLFDYVKSFGLCNADIGTRYANEILSKGGGTDPETLLKNFLGRNPQKDAFLADLVS